VGEGWGEGDGKPITTRESVLKTAVIVIDHGSRFQAANEMLEEVGKMLRARNAFDIVEVAHMELADPSLDAAFDACVRQGAERVVVQLYFLSPGRHSQSDIPRMTAEAAARHSGVEAVVTEPLGLDERLIDVVVSRVRESIAEEPSVA